MLRVWLPRRGRSKDQNANQRQQDSVNLPVGFINGCCHSLYHTIPPPNPPVEVSEYPPCLHSHHFHKRSLAVEPLQGLSYSVTSVAFSPDGVTADIFLDAFHNILNVTCQPPARPPVVIKVGSSVECNRCIGYSSKLLNGNLTRRAPIMNSEQQRLRGSVTVHNVH